ncbi:hypothetical protein LTR53_011772 [Teratosphaeriaceae sp. CCFEE 6253]|nr:hypothetical protein LTR53_011772 [Teratosphaeriaceae sp. CCFEE 6253]
MALGCFRPGRGAVQSECNPPARPRLAPNDRAKSSKTRMLRRQGTSDSRSSTSSNDSISKLAPCSRVSDPLIDAMMMPVPTEAKPSRCRRLSLPKTYSDIVETMKCEKGCRDWRNFAVFHDDEIDMKKSAVEYAKRKAADYERKARESNSFSSGDDVRNPCGGSRSTSLHVGVECEVTSPEVAATPNTLTWTSTPPQSISKKHTTAHPQPTIRRIPRRRLKHHIKMSTTNTITTTCERPHSLLYSKQTVPLLLPASSLPERRKAETSMIDSISRPYLALLMPEPVSDREQDAAERREDARALSSILFRYKRNKDWRSIPVFLEEDDDFSEPLSPLEAESEQSDTAISPS